MHTVYQTKLAIDACEREKSHVSDIAKKVTQSVMLRGNETVAALVNNKVSNQVSLPIKSYYFQI